MRIRKLLMIILILLLLYIFIGSILPFVRQPEVSEATAESFRIEDFYGDDISDERAYIVSDSGEALELRIRMIAEAEEEIIYSTGEFRSDKSGKAVLSALLAASERGVNVRLLVDGFGEIMQMHGNEYFIALSESENVDIRIYNRMSVLRPWSIHGLLHDKYIIVDDALYLLGGRNTYDLFLGEQDGSQKPDWELLVYNNGGRAESLEELRSYFESVWIEPKVTEYAGFGKSIKKSATERAADELEAIYEDLQREHPDCFEPTEYYSITKPVKKIKLITNPVHTSAKEPVAFYSMTRLMQSADEEVRFHTPYIIADEYMNEELSKICEAVPRVVMMTNSVANNANPFGAMDYFKNKDKALDTGVDILEYDGGISYHGKCFVMDDDISGIGSFNWDMRSVYVDTEMMLVIHSEEINRDLRKAMGEYEENALVVTGLNSYDLPEDLLPHELGWRRRIKLELLWLPGRFMRFLM